MVKTGCTIDGQLDVSKFNQPIPWIGLYIAAASAACAAAMAVDTVHGLRYRKLWFPTRFFSLNATSLTLLAVATKLSVDLNASMPGKQDQLAKLSSTVLVCTAMANFMPSIGTMENQELLANMVALGIFVITVMVNVCIEMITGAIYVFWREYVITLAVMMILLALMVSSAITIPITKKYFEMKSRKKLKLAKKECSDVNGCHPQKVNEKLKMDLTKYWMMAHTGNPQFVMARLSTCSASGAFCLVSTATLAEAVIRSFFYPSQFRFCQGDTDYEWSSMLILITQAIGIVIGTLAPASRYFATINFRCPKKANKACKNKFKMEKYWTIMLSLLKENPIESRFYSRQSRKIAHTLKDRTLDLCIYTQIGVVWLSKLVRFLSLMLIIRFLLTYQSCLELLKWITTNNRFCQEIEHEPHPIQELSRFVMYLDGEEDFIDMMMQRNYDATGHWIRMGKKQQPKHAINLLEKLCSSKEFEGVNQFDSDLVHSLDSDEPPNCWALPVVTLTSIAVALPNVDVESRKKMIQCVNEALIYIRLIEDNLDAKKKLENVRQAAAVLWTGVDLHYKWLDVDLREISDQDKNPKQILEELSEKAKHRYKVFRENDPLICLREDASTWPIKVLAANSMYRICQTLLASSDSREWDSGNLVFEKLSAMIAEITGACFTNLQYTIAEQCYQSSIEEMEDRTRHSICLLGKTEKILELLEQQTLPSYKPQKSLHIDQWRLFSKSKEYSKSSSLNTDDTQSSSSPDLYLNID